MQSLNCGALLLTILGLIAAGSRHVTVAAPISSNLPVPAVYDGYTYPSNPVASSSSDSSLITWPYIILEGYFDLLCSDCKAAWPTVKNVMAAYNESVVLRVHTFPLPYHQNAFIVNQGAHVVANLTASSRDGEADYAFFKYLEMAFKFQNMFLNAETADKSPNVVISDLANLAEKELGDAYPEVTADAMVAGLANGDLNEATRVSWKYSASQGVSGTPTFMVNGVRVTAGSDTTEKEWKEFLDPLVHNNAAAAAAAQAVRGGEKGATSSVGSGGEERRMIYPSSVFAEM